MRTYNYQYENDDVLLGCLKGISVQESESVLVRIHSAIHSAKEVTELSGRIKACLPSAHITGCSAMQIISEGRLIPDSCLISVTVFEKSEILTGKISCLDENGEWKGGAVLGNELLNSLNSRGNGFMLIFFPLAYSKIEEFTETVNRAPFSVKMLGGAAYYEDKGGNARPDLAYVIADGTAAYSDAAYAYITTPDLYIYGDYVCGVEAVGSKSRIKSKGCLIEEIDGISGAEWYSSMLGAGDGLKNDPSLSHVFPLVKRDGKGIAYYVDYVPVEKSDGSGAEYQLRSFGELENGSIVSLGYFNPQNIFDYVSEMIGNVRKSPAESVFAFD